MHSRRTRIDEPASNCLNRPSEKFMNLHQRLQFHATRITLLCSIAVLALSSFACSAQSATRSVAPAHVFAVDGDHFTLDGKPFQIVSGELHYTRIPREYWHARLKMAKAMGLNTIATYVFWNVHEPRPGVYDFSGQNDLAAFIRAAQEEGLYVILRAGPYSCAEWEFGGFPAWLLKDPKMSRALRTNDDVFMVPAERWIDRLAQETSPLLVAHGGPILAVQVENEYGNFGNEHAYMQHMLKIFQSTGFKDAVLYTVDPSKALANGELDGILSGVNFGTGNAELALAKLAAQRPGAPLFATEYWPGWFDLFGVPHATRPLAPQLKDIDYVLGHNGSINIYMFHGGTSFGMMPGASASTGNYRGNVTSYDYDAPLDEAGHPTAKFFAYRDLILSHTHEPALPLPAVAPVIALPQFTLRPTASLWKNLPKPIASQSLLTMEQIDQSYGYILYRIQLAAPVDGKSLVINPVHDYAQIYLDSKLVGTLDRHYNQSSLVLTSTTPATLEILVENSGRLNSTRNIRNEWKGIQSATLDGKPLTGWQIYSLPMENVAAMQSAAPTADAVQGPHFAAGSFTLAQTGDSFLDITSLGKGLIWINGHALGRFWNIGPQDTLYIPAPWLKKGLNEVVVFDLFAATGPQELVGLTKPILDGPTPTYADDPERKKKLAADAEFGPKLATPAPTPSTTPTQAAPKE
jgi:beta-galactosidase